MIRKPINEANEQIVHTPIGSTIKPVKFANDTIVTTKQEISADNVKIPNGVQLTVVSSDGDDMYTLIGPNGLVVKLNGVYLEKVEGGTVWGNL